MNRKLQALHLALVNTTGPILLHDNAQPHVAQPIFQKLNKVGYKVLPHPPYSPEVKVLVAQLCLTPCNFTDSSPPGSSVYGILQVRILQWVAILFSRGSSQPRDWTWVSWIAGGFFTIWATREALTVTWPFTKWLSLLQASRQLFAGKTLPKPAGDRKCFSRVCWIAKHRFLHYRNKQTYSCWQKHADYNGSYFD